MCNGDSVLIYSFFFNHLIENSLDLFTLELKYNRGLIFQNKNENNSPSSFFAVGLETLAFISIIYTQTHTFKGIEKKNWPYEYF